MNKPAIVMDLDDFGPEKANPVYDFLIKLNGEKNENENESEDFI